MSEECLFDGFDCARTLGNCNPHYDTYCKLVYNNGICDAVCDTAACNWDGSDCGHQEQLSTGTLILYVGVAPDVFRNMTKEFLRILGSLLRAVLITKLDQNQEEMIYSWYKPITSGRFRRAVGSNQPSVSHDRELLG